MGFGEAIQSVFSKYATFSGRARRSEYWYFVLLQVIVTAVLNGLYSATESVAFSTILVLFDLALLVPSLAVCWRRLHDSIPRRIKDHRSQEQEKGRSRT